MLVGAWRRCYNAVRPHGSMRWKTPAPEAILIPAWPTRRIAAVETEANALTLQPDAPLGAVQSTLPYSREAIAAAVTPSSLRTAVSSSAGS